MRIRRNDNKDDRGNPEDTLKSTTSHEVSQEIENFLNGKLSASQNELERNSHGSGKLDPHQVRRQSQGQGESEHPGQKPDEASLDLIGRFQNSRIWLKAKAWFGGNRNKAIGTAAAAAVVLTAGIWLFFTLLIKGGTPTSAEPQQVIPLAEYVLESASAGTLAEPELKVHIVGAVANEGIYVFEPQARIQDIIEQAGGGLSEADINTLNLAAYVNDGQKICVPYQSGILENGGNGCDSHSLQPASSYINVNRADPSQLEELTGIGPALAQAIVDYREANGDFESLDDLAAVSGITSNVVDRFRSQAAVR